MAVGADTRGGHLSDRQYPARQRIADVACDGSAHHRVPGEPGIWILVFGDLVVFGLLFTVYLYRRGQDEQLFAASQLSFSRTAGVANTLILLTSSLLLVLALSALRDPQRRFMARRLTIAAMAVGSCFVVLKFFEYREKILAGITPATNEYFTYYYTLTGLHLFHLTVGLGVLVTLTRVARKPAPTRSDLAFFECGACYWHMVDLLWIAIFPLLALVG